eukprot:1189828-Prorocentrum_minimum.AAC.4
MHARRSACSMTTSNRYSQSARPDSEGSLSPVVPLASAGSESALPFAARSKHSPLPFSASLASLPMAWDDGSGDSVVAGVDISVLMGALGAVRVTSIEASVINRMQSMPRGSVGQPRANLGRAAAWRHLHRPEGKHVRDDGQEENCAWISGEVSRSLEGQIEVNRRTFDARVEKHKGFGNHAGLDTVPALEIRERICVFPAAKPPSPRSHRT